MITTLVLGVGIGLTFSQPSHNKLNLSNDGVFANVPHLPSLWSLMSFTIMLILLLHSNFLQLMGISFYIFGFVTIMWIFFAIFGFSYKWDWSLDYKTYSNTIIVGFTRLTFSMGDVTKATTVIHLVTFYWHPFVP